MQADAHINSHCYMIKYVALLLRYKVAPHKLDRHETDTNSALAAATAAVPPRCLQQLLQAIARGALVLCYPSPAAVTPRRGAACPAAVPPVYGTRGACIYVQFTKVKSSACFWLCTSHSTCADYCTGPRLAIDAVVDIQGFVTRVCNAQQEMDASCQGQQVIAHLTRRTVRAEF